MNKRIFTVAVATMVMGFGLQAQNNGNTGPTLKGVGGGYSQDNRILENFDSKNYQKVEVSEGLQIKSTGENSYVIYKEIKNQPSKIKNNYNFKIIIESEMSWMGNITIGNGDDFFELVGWWNVEDNIYETTLPEGYYDIVVSGQVPNYDWFETAIIFFDQIHIDKNTELTADFTETFHTISLAPVDDDNVLIGDWAEDNTDIFFIITMHPSINMSNSWRFFGFPISDINFHVKDMGDRNKLQVAVGAYNEIKGDEYFISFPEIVDGITEDIVLQNTSEEIIHFKQIINVPENFDDVLYSYTGFLQINYDFELMHSWVYYSGATRERIRDKDAPYSLYSNIRYNETPKTRDMNMFVLPLSYDFYNFEMPRPWDFRGLVAGNPMAINDDGELIMNFFPKFSGVLGSLNDINEIIGSLGNNPLTKVWNEEEFYYEGFRTPILYHQSMNFTAETNPYEINGVNDFWFLFLGEFGEQKFNHGDMTVKITGDGTEIYNDQIFKLYAPRFWGLNLDGNCSKYEIEIFNDDVFAYGRRMVNHSFIEFDMTTPDVDPPTLTMLRVIDNEKISMFISDINSARLEITAADYKFAFEEIPGEPGEYYAFIAYDKKPDIEIFWSSDGETFHELPAAEDESKFHLGYGNFFNVSLAPLAEAGIEEGWITIKIILTDEVGNSQVQLLNPLFYYGDFVGIDKQILSNKLTSSAYPNPFTEKITVELENPVSGLTYFEIYDITGRIIHQQKTDANNTKSFTYNGKHLKAGVYFYGIYNGGNVVSGKIVKN